MATEERLKSLESIQDVGEQLEGYRSLVGEMMQQGQIDDLPSVLQAIIGRLPPKNAVEIAKQLVEMCATSSLDAQEQLLSELVNAMQQRPMGYEEELVKMQQRLTEVYESQEEWSKAARTLAAIDLQGGGRQAPEEARAAQLIRVARLFFEDSDSVAAEQYIKRASQLMGGVKDAQLQLQYQVCYARILDAKRKFLEAAFRYYQISCLAGKNFGGQQIDATDLLAALRQAVVCSCLAQAGPQRSRMLATLVKDERTAQLHEYAMLESMYKDRLLERSEVAAFQQSLQPHHLATLASGATVLDSAVTQHNILAASKLYTCIQATDLGTLVDRAPEAALDIAAAMVAEGRLAGSVDQVQGLVNFRPQQAEQVTWDELIKDVCQQASSIAERIQSTLQPTGAS